MAQKKKNVKKDSAKGKQKKIKQSILSNRVKAIICLAVAILLFAVMVVRGENVWNAVHNFMYGVFGICGFAVVAFLVALAYRYEKGRSERHSVARFWCVVVSIILLESLIHVIFVMLTDTQGFAEGVRIAFGGFWQGVIGALVGGLLVMAMGELGSLILLIVVAAVTLLGDTMMDWLADKLAEIFG